MTTPAEYMIEAVEAACDVALAVPYRPARLDGKMAFVAPADEWKLLDEEGTYCGFTIGLDVYLVAPSTDQGMALAWLDAQSSILMALDPIDVGDDRVFVTTVDAPFVFTTGDGSTFFATRCIYSRHTTGV